MTEPVTGNDGLTNAEREELATRYRTTGAGRPLTPAEEQAARKWLETKRNNR